VGGGSKITFTSRLPQRGHMRRLPSLPRGKRSPFAQIKRLHVPFSLEIALLEPRRRFHGASKAAGADPPAQPVSLSRSFN